MHRLTHKRLALALAGVALPFFAVCTFLHLRAPVALAGDGITWVHGIAAVAREPLRALGVRTSSGWWTSRTPACVASAFRSPSRRRPRSPGSSCSRSRAAATSFAAPAWSSSCPWRLLVTLARIPGDRGRAPVTTGGRKFVAATDLAAQFGRGSLPSGPCFASSSRREPSNADATPTPPHPATPTSIPSGSGGGRRAAPTALATFRTAAEILRERPGLIFNHNEAILYRWVERYDPPLFEEIRALVARGAVGDRRRLGPAARREPPRPRVARAAHARRAPVVPGTLRRRAPGRLELRLLRPPRGPPADPPSGRLPPVHPHAARSPASSTSPPTSTAGGAPTGARSSAYRIAVGLYHTERDNLEARLARGDRARAAARPRRPGLLGARRPRRRPHPGWTSTGSTPSAPGRAVSRSSTRPRSVLLDALEEAGRARRWSRGTSSGASRGATPRSPG